LYYTLSPAIARLPRLTRFLEWEVRLGLPVTLGQGSAMVGWGSKRSYHWAKCYADLRGIPCLSLEDGFLRSVGLGRQEPPLSLVVDDLGIYYDASGPSRLERLIAETRLDEDQIARACQLVTDWRSGRLSKYNQAREWAPLHVDGHAHDRSPSLSYPRRRVSSSIRLGSRLSGSDEIMATPDRGHDDLPASFVLVVDQTFGDASIRYGLADADSFRRMLEAALDEHPATPILLKVHPEVFAGRKRGHFDGLTPGQASRVRVLGRDVHAPSLLERAEAVYTVTSQMGFEGLLWGRPVRTFGMPFYAGWGLTRDDLAAPDRRRPVALEALVHAALVAYPRYVEPETGERCEVERVMAWLAWQRRMRQRFPAEVHAIGFGRLRRPMARAFFQGSTLHHHRDAATVPQGGTLAVWGRAAATDVEDAWRSWGLGPASSSEPSPASGGGQGGGDARQGMRGHDEGHVGALITLEDGFLRSVGLGAELVQPLSLVMDRVGIYYDAGRPSELEAILQETDVDADLLDRAARLRARIVEAGLTKYNVGGAGWRRPDGARQVILVPGQVERDASIRYGSAQIKTNLDLLKAVRAQNPDAYLVYKPHPDVQAGLRLAGRGEATAADHCDEVVLDVAMDRLLDQVDAVHVLTSLAGFEALLRQRPVTTYGQPFYAGWGLTEDLYPVERRTRRLSLDELVAGTLILYPAYVSRVTGRFTTPERALEELLAWREESAAGMPLWRSGLRKLLQAWERLAPRA
jgi:capsular polysaccharide export protein